MNVCRSNHVAPQYIQRCRGKCSSASTCATTDSSAMSGSFFGNFEQAIDGERIQMNNHFSNMLHWTSDLNTKWRIKTYWILPIYNSITCVMSIQTPFRHLKINAELNRSECLLNPRTHSQRLLFLLYSGMGESAGLLHDRRTHRGCTGCTPWFHRGSRANA